MRHRPVLLIALGAALLLSGCGSTRTVTVTTSSATKQAAPRVPPAPLARGVPASYRAKQVWHVDLSGGLTPEVVVTSVGPPVTSLGFHSADLRVLEWDPIAKRWGIAFDAQKVIPRDSHGDPGSSNVGPGYYPPTTTNQAPLLDPKAAVMLGPVRFGKLLPGHRQQLIFSASMNYGGSGVPGVLATVDFKAGLANLVYTWQGEGLGNWQTTNGKLQASAWYWTPADAHCCPLRSYRFTVAARHGYLTEIADDRPWLGVAVRELGSGGDFGPLQITGFAEHSPAAGHLQVGDVLLDVLNAPAPSTQPGATAVSSIFDKLSMFKAGQSAKLLVGRGDSRITVTVPLGSLKDTYSQPLPTTDFTINAL